jgi:type 1 glutamine amidotransferase
MRILVLLTAAATAGLCRADEPSQLRVLLLSGQNNHDWRQTTPLIREGLEGCGRFVVEVTEHPERVHAETLSAYAVVVSNWNSFHRDKPPPVVDWPPETRRAFVDFVRHGGGFVTVHAGGSSFYDDTWPTYHELVIARYGFGQTAHGVQHAFAVQIEDGQHPITRGMRDFFLHDELWHRPAVVSGATVLASAFSSTESKGSGQYEPVAFVRRFGQGRCFATLLGHGPRALRNPAFTALLARGTEWAATGNVTLPLPANWPDTPADAHALRQLVRSGGLENLARQARADSPDGLEPDLGGKEAPAVNDGNLDTYWDEENGKPLYRLRLTFDQPTTIATIAITGYKHHYAAPRDFSVSCDGKATATLTGIEYTDNHVLIDVPETTCTVLELEITGYYGPSPGVRELEVYGPIDQQPETRLGWQRTESTLTLVNNGRAVWTLHFGRDLPKPYFHPIGLLDGTTLTWASPADHPWHHGHWFSWKYINGVNYWEENRETGLSAGRTSIRDVTIQARDNHGARIEMLLDYGPAGEQAVLRERRVIEVSAPDEAGRYHLDWAMTFTAGQQDVRLDRTPLPHEPDGKIWGGYAGLAFRLAEDFQDLSAVSTAGEVTDWKDQRHRSRAPAMEYHGHAAGRPAGIAIIDHPENLNAPSPWYLINSDPMRYINPAVICYQPHELAAGASFTLRYRVIVHPGHWDAAELRRQIENYVNRQEE